MKEYLKQTESTPQFKSEGMIVVTEDESILREKIEFNRSRFLNEFNQNEIGKTKLNINLVELLSKLQGKEEKLFFEDAITIYNLNYDLVVHHFNNDLRLDVIGKNEQIFDANRSNNSSIAGWIAQGDYALGDETVGYYSSKDHWGVSVSSNFKGTGLSDLLYNLKALTDNQLEFEHVFGSYYQSLTFYIKKGYVPYSVIRFPDLHEEVLTGDEIETILKDIVNKRKNNNHINETDVDYAFKLKLDPKEAEVIYTKIHNY